MKLIAMALLLAAAPAAAAWEAGIDQTFGSRSYRQTGGYAIFGSTYTVRPAFSLSRSDSSPGTFSTFSIGLTRYTRPWSAGLTLGASPQHNGYSRAYGDLSTSKRFYLDSKNVRLIRLGASVRETLHRDHFQFIETGRLDRSGNSGSGGGGGDDSGGDNHGGGDFRQGFSQARPTPVNILQTDLSASVGAELRDLWVKVGATGYLYDKDLAAINARETLSEEIAGVSPLLEGYPSASINGLLEWRGWRMATPYVSYAHTTFMLGAFPADALGAGVGVDWGPASFSAGYEAFEQGDLPRRNYFTIGASLGF